MNGAIGAAASPVDLTRLPRGLAPIPLRDPCSVRLERPQPAAPGEPLVCGEYGPRFVGFGPVPAPTLAQRATPWLLGLACGIAGCLGAIGYEFLTGAI
jgi:hypothetical protein